MNLIVIESIFLFLFIIGILTYIKGKKDNVLFLVSVGRRSSIILGVLIVVYNLFIMKKNLKKLLLSIQKEPMEKQKEILEEKIENWKGTLEQADDLLVMGIKV